MLSDLIVRDNVEFCTGAWAWLEIWPKISVPVFARGLWHKWLLEGVCWLCCGPLPVKRQAGVGGSPSPLM